MSRYRPVLFLSESEDDDEPEFLKSSVNFRSVPSKFRSAHRKGKSHEDLNGSYIPKFQNSPLSIDISESDSDETFSNIIENIRKNQTPVSENRQDIGGTKSDSDESFTNIIENLRKCQTPVVQKKLIYEEGESDNDEAISEIIEKVNAIQVPKSQTKSRQNFFSPKSEKQELPSASLKEAVLQQSSAVRMTNKKEYAALFPSQHMHLSSTDQVVYGQKLFKFFNEKIFNSRLPEDMPLIWSNSLLRSAGMTHCRYKDGIRSCYITLSSSLLLSFDRLQDTLLHEMCHAAVWIISEGSDHHGPLWKTWASRCKLILPFVHCPERCHNYEITRRVWYECLNCDFRVGRCRQSRKLQRSICKKCKTPLVMTTH